MVNFDIPVNSGNFSTRLGFKFKDFEYTVGKVISRPGGLEKMCLPYSPPEGATSR
jgi:hypothetical protein